MANWSNLRLVVTGYPDDLATFRRAAGALEGRIDTSKSKVFTSAMEFGEGRDLEAEDVSLFRRRFHGTTYLFQGRNTDHVDHFIRISRRYPRLAFVLAWSEPNVDAHGSYVLLNGHTREWRMGEPSKGRIYKKHYRLAGVIKRNGGVDYDADEADSAEWDAMFEMMDVAQSHWDGAVAGYLTRRVRPPKPQPRVAPESAARGVFIDVETVVTRDAAVAMLGVLHGETHTVYLLDEGPHPAAIANTENCRTCLAEEAIEAIVNQAQEVGGHIVSWSEHDLKAVLGLDISAGLKRRFQSRYCNALADARRWKNRLYPDEKLPRVDGDAGHSLKAYMVATGFCNQNQLQPGTAAERLRHTLEQLRAKGGKHRGVTRKTKRDWHDLLAYNRLDCQALKYVWERATRELALEEAYLATTFQVDVLGASSTVRPNSRANGLQSALKWWKPAPWAIITAYNPQSRILSDAENTSRDIALKGRLDKEKLLHFSAVAVGSSDWIPERSLLVLGISRGKVIALAHEFGQAAIVCGRRGKRAALVWCNTLKFRGSDAQCGCRITL